ncbi:SpoIIE family protein phosphatase [Streptomyces canarius]
MTAESFPTDDDPNDAEPPRRTSLLDVLSVAALVLDTDGRIVFWTPQAEELFGYSADEALGRQAARLIIHPEHLQAVVKLFADVMATGRSWAGAFPIRYKDGSTRLMEFRNMRLLDDLGDVYALGLAADHSLLQRVETDLALCERLINQSPIGLALLDPDLRYLLVNPALERIDGIPAEDHLGRRLRETLPFPDVDTVESALRQVLTTGTPLLVTCLYAVFDPHTRQCRMANAGHMPPALARTGEDPRLLDLPSGAPLGVGGIRFETTTAVLGPGDLLVLYTDGLVETRQHSIDDRLNTLLGFLDAPERPLEETCDLLLHGLRHPDDHDDVALLVARAL